MEQFMDILADAAIDTLKLIPFLLVTYFIMELIEGVAEDKAEAMVRKAGFFGPLVGALVGAFPQCGFSAAAATLYAGRVITLGTLFAVFLATSDEMIPIFIAEQTSPDLLFKVLACKVVIGMVLGFLVDLVQRIRHKGAGHLHIHDLCEQEHCQCSDGPLKSSIKHTLQVSVFIFLITFVLGGAIELAGEEAIAGFLGANPALSVCFAGLVGLIPNCAASVIICELFLDGTLSTGAMMAGLLVGAGIGLLVLCRENRRPKSNLFIIALLWAMGVVVGFGFDFLGIVF